jgi:hypothetical protein
VVRDAQGNVIMDENLEATVDEDNPIYAGPVHPTREIGFTNTLTLFGSLQLYAHLDYKGGQTIWCALCSVRSRIDDNHWEVNDPNATPEQLAQWTSLQTLTHLMPGDFLKFRELSLTYQLPTRWSALFRADRASINLAARDIGLWTRYKPYRGQVFDPEVQFHSTQTFTTLDYGSTPMVRRLTASVRMQF